MSSRTGQATIEYLIILAVIIVIALIVVGVLGGFPAFGASITEQQSKLYWKSASPLAITQWQTRSNSVTGFIIQNNSTDKIILEEVYVRESGDWISLDIIAYNPNRTILPGSQLDFTSQAITCSGNSVYSYNVRLIYSIEGGLEELIELGQKPLVGTCSG